MMMKCIKQVMHNAIARQPLTDSQPFPSQRSPWTLPTWTRFSCSGPLTLLWFWAIQVFRRIRTIFFPFSNTSWSVLPHVMTTSMHWMCSDASTCSRAVWISPLKILGLFPALGHQILGGQDDPPCESKAWPSHCCQRHGEKRISNINCGIVLGCLWLQFVLNEVLACTAQQHSVVVGLHSGHRSPPLSSIYH